MKRGCGDLLIAIRHQADADQRERVLLKGYSRSYVASISRCRQKDECYHPREQPFSLKWVSRGQVRWDTHVWPRCNRWRWSPRLDWTPCRCICRYAPASGSSESASTSSDGLRQPPAPSAACRPSARRSPAEGSHWPCTWAAPSCRRGALSSFFSSWSGGWSEGELDGK